MNIGSRKFIPVVNERPLTPDEVRLYALISADIALAYDALRALCDDFGDQHWYEGQPLHEIIKNHLGWHLYNDTDRIPGTHRCQICKEIRADVTFGKSELLEERTGDEGERWICKSCLDKARAEHESQYSD